MAVPPVFKAHLRVEIIPGEGVVVLSENSSRALYGKLYERVVPLIDGTRDADAIVDALAGVVEPAKVYYALALLEQNGHIATQTPEIAPAIAAYWHALGVEPRAALHALSTRTVRVRAVGEVDTTSVRHALREAGITITEDDSASLELIITDDYLREALTAINATALTNGKPWLLVKPGGVEPWIGPLYLPATTGCHQCLHNRLERHRPVPRFVADKKKLAELPFAPTASIAPALDAACAIAVAEIAKFLAGAACGLEGTVLSVDTRSWAVERHALQKQPGCTACGTPSHERPGPVTLVSRPIMFRQDGGQRVVAPEETLKRYQHLISPITGVVSALVPWQTIEGVAYVFGSGHNFAIRAVRLDSLKRGLRNWSAGKGMSEVQAKASALCEGIEHFSGAHDGSEFRITASYRELGPDAIHPGDVMRYSEKQFQERDAWNARGSKFNIVPERFDEEARVDWTPLWSLTEERQKYLPTQLLYFRAPASAGRHIHYCMGCSNGNASGNTIEEAVLQGFLELVERDSVALWWYNRLKKPGVDIASFSERRLLDLIAHHETLGREVWALDITTDLGIPAFVALSRKRDGSEERILFGLGCHFDARIALARAISEMQQMLGFAAETGSENGELTLDDAETLSWLKTATGANQPYLLPDERVPPRRREDYPVHQSTDLLDDIRRCKQIVETRGMEMLVLDQTRSDVGVPVVKVVVPGLRHFWARFAPGRLYDVPVQMGWLDQPLTEEELNPIPVFI